MFAIVPARLWPNRKSSPTSSQRVFRTPVEDRRDEIVGLELRQARIELRDVHLFDAGIAEALELVGQRRQPRRDRGAGLSCEEFLGRRMKRQHCRRKAQVCRGIDRALEHRDVRAMNTVEIADRQRKRRPVSVCGSLSR
jgi:hypothetical protein